MPLFSITGKRTSFTISFTCGNTTYGLTQLLGHLQTLAHPAHLALEVKGQNEIMPKEVKELGRVPERSAAARSAGRSASISLGESYSALLYNSYLRI